MADKPKDKKKDEKAKPKKHNAGEMSFATEFVLFILGIFILWVLVGQPKSENADKPFIKDQATIN